MRNKILLICTIVMIIVIGSSVSFYKDFKEGQAEATIAKPIVVIEGDSSFNIDDINEHTLGTSNTFIVKNYDLNNNITETKMKYYIEFVSNSVDINKISLSLTRNGSNINITNNKTPEYELVTDKKQEDTFVLKVKYNGTEDVTNGKISLKLHSYQIQPE